MSGWGKDTFGDGGNYQHLLKEVDLPVLDSRDCEKKLRRTRLGNDFVLHPGTTVIQPNQTKERTTKEREREREIEREREREIACVCILLSCRRRLKYVRSIT